MIVIGQAVPTASGRGLSVEPKTPICLKDGTWEVLVFFLKEMGLWRRIRTRSGRELRGPGLGLTPE